MGVVPAGFWVFALREHRMTMPVWRSAERKPRRGGKTGQLMADNVQPLILGCAYWLAEKAPQESLNAGRGAGGRWVGVPPVRRQINFDQGNSDACNS
jgi:hypothetical protein